MSVVPLLCLVALIGSAARAAAQEHLLWFQQPATTLIEAILLGNGRLGAAHFGAVANERFALNEDSIWAGSPYDPANVGCAAFLGQAREIVNEGSWQEAQQFLNAHCMGTPESQAAYQTAGSLLLNVSVSANPITNYRRQLDLNTAVMTMTYTQDGVDYTREAFVSFPAQVIVVHLSASQPGRHFLNASLVSPMPNNVTRATANNIISLTASNSPGAGGPIPANMNYESRMQVLTSGGSVTPANASGPTESFIAIGGADEVTLLIAIASSFVDYTDGASGNAAERNTAVFDALPSTDYTTLKAAHVQSYNAMYSRVSFDLSPSGSGDSAALPTDQRVPQQNGTQVDAGLISLFVHLGRYLLISSSRGGAQPPNLQGIWQTDLDAPWNSKFTTNINLEMNYWGAEVMNLADTVEPLVRLMEDISVTGARTAQVMYNASSTASGTGGGPGQGAPWVLHHNTDQWRATAPIDDAFFGFWPTGGAWELQTLWEHFLFDPSNRTFAARIYPLFRGSSQFFSETLQVHPNESSWLVVNPSLSPEHAFLPDVSITLGPTLDNALVFDVFNQTDFLASVLGTDSDFARNITSIRDELPPFRIGDAGQLQEWLEDWDLLVPEVQFAHISHLYTVYPGSRIDPRINMTLAIAATQSLIYRGIGQPGWPIAWRVGAWARLMNANQTMAEINALFSTGGISTALLSNLGGTFQIDANLGGMATILEAFLQSHNGEIHILPCVPSQLHSGSFSGLRARGGFIVDVSWSGGLLTSARVTSAPGTVAFITERQRENYFRRNSSEVMRRDAARPGAIRVRYAGGNQVMKITLDQGGSRNFTLQELSSISNNGGGPTNGAVWSMQHFLVLHILLVFFTISSL